MLKGKGRAGKSPRNNDPHTTKTSECALTKRGKDSVKYPMLIGLGAVSCGKKVKKYLGAYIWHRVGRKTEYRYTMTWS